MSASFSIHWSHAGVFVLLLASFAFLPALAQAQVPDSVRQAAMKDFHGDDMTGKDGPLAKAGMDLLTLYHSRAASGEDSSLEQTSSDDVSGMQVRDGRVLIDATARGDADALADALRDLGATGVEVASPVVSARLPVSRIPDAARLDALQTMRPSRPMTNQGASRSDQSRLAAAATGSGEAESGEAAGKTAADASSETPDSESASSSSTSNGAEETDDAVAPSRSNNPDADEEATPAPATGESPVGITSNDASPTVRSVDAASPSSSGGGADGVTFFFLLALLVVLFFES